MDPPMSQRQSHLIGQIEQDQGPGIHLEQFHFMNYKALGSYTCPLVGYVLVIGSLLVPEHTEAMVFSRPNFYGGYLS